MMVVVSYDVATETDGGKRRLRRVAKVCQDYGQRVQYSIFECIVDPAQWVVLKKNLLNEIDPEHDSLRFYFLGSKWRRKIEQVGAKESLDQEGALIL